MDVIIFSDVNGVAGYGRYAGAYKVATELRYAGYSTQVIEFFADLSLDEIKNIAEKFIDKSTLFVGFATTLFIGKTKSSCLSRIDRTKENRSSGHLPQDYEFVEEMFSILRRRNRNLKIVIGGGKSNVTNMPGVDYWVWGYADKSVIALADHLKKGTVLKTYEAQNGRAISSRDYPYSDYNKSKIIWQPHDHLFEKEHLPIEIDRGCVFRCAFCAHPLHKKKGEYKKDLQVLKDEFLFNYEQFGTTGYMFCDDTYNDSYDKVKSMHRLFNQLPFSIEWIGYGRVDTIFLHPEQRELLLEKSGLKAILVGLETFHPTAGKVVGKGLHPENVKETLYFLRELWKGKIITTGSFIVGLPGEPVDSIWNTVEWLQRDDCPLDDAIFSPLNIRSANDNPDAPMSKFAKNPNKYGYNIVDYQIGTGISTYGPQWINEYMDKAYAERLTNQIQKIFSKRQPVADWAVYSRLRNLGYSQQDLLSKKSKDLDITAEGNYRRESMKRKYLSWLLAH